MNIYFPRVEGVLDGRERHHHDAQHADAARRPGARRAEVGQLSRRDHRAATATDTEVEVPSHPWPHWGTRRSSTIRKKQRDPYKYLHDQSVRLMNEGYTGARSAN